MSPIDPVPVTEAVTRPVHQITRTYVRVPFLGVRWSVWCRQCDRWLVRGGGHADCVDVEAAHIHRYGPIEVTP